LRVESEVDDVAIDRAEVKLLASEIDVLFMQIIDLLSPCDHVKPFIQIRAEIESHDGIFASQAQEQEAL